MMSLFGLSIMLFVVTCVVASDEEWSWKRQAAFYLLMCLLGTVDFLRGVYRGKDDTCAWACQADDYTGGEWVSGEGCHCISKEPLNDL